MRIAFALLTLAFATITGAAPSEMPNRKPGLWEIKMQMPDMEQPTLSQHCIDEKTDNILLQQGHFQPRQNCSKNNLRKESGKIILESECKIEGSNTSTKAVFSGDFSHSYRGEIHTTYTPSLHGMKTSMQTLEGKWLGVCKPGQKPGDIAIPGVSP